jgi:hypothetical protein
MGGKSAPSVDVPDPLEIIREGRTNSVGPFGSSTWNGRTQTTTLSPQMQGAFDQLMQVSQRPMERVELPDYLGDIGAGVASRVGSRYGVGEKPPPSAAPPAPDLPPPAPPPSAPPPESPVFAPPPTDPVGPIPAIPSPPPFSFAPEPGRRDQMDFQRQLRELMNLRNNLPDISGFSPSFQDR